MGTARQPLEPRHLWEPHILGSIMRWSKTILWRETVAFARACRVRVSTLAARTPFWRLWKAPEDRTRLVDEERESLLELIHLGDQLAHLRHAQEWTALLQVKEQLQQIATETTRRRPMSGEDGRGDRDRLIAASEYWGVESLFRNVDRIITQAQTARRLVEGREVMTK